MIFIDQFGYVHEIKLHLFGYAIDLISNTGRPPEYKLIQLKVKKNDTQM